MKIVADENIPFVKEAFAGFGEIETLPGRQITAEHLKDADMLLVRSVTRVDEALLRDSAVRFVGTATIGTDHVDRAFLHKSNIGFAFAPGSNAESVAQYVVTALLQVCRDRGMDPASLTLGVVGVGNIGTRVYRHALALGMRCLLNDPPKKRLTGSDLFVDLDDLLAQSDAVTLHVPLVKSGEYPTVYLANAAFFGALRAGALFINTSRGQVVNEAHLLQHRQRLGGLVLDVWENEPAINPEVVACTDIATPHIAGYSYDGKVNGTGMLADAAAAFFFKEVHWQAASVLDREPVKTILLASGSDSLADAVAQAYPIRDDDAPMRRLPPRDDERGAAFDKLRRDYPRRLEFRHFRIEPAESQHASVLRSLGFVV